MSVRSGFLLINKPSGITSHDVVNITRKILKTKKIGHTGTLDPLASGVMLLGVNQATRLNEYLLTNEKEYIATFYFGEERDTQDIHGNIIRTCSLPTISKSLFEKVLQSFLGEQLQTPPMYSAIKKDGKPLYKYARENIAVNDIEDRHIFIHSIECLSFSNQKASIKVHCSKGTYIRTLCKDIAIQCGSCGTLSDLKRIRVGSFELTQCINIEEMQSIEDPYQVLIPMHQILNLPIIHIFSETDAMDIMNGKQIVTNEIANIETLSQIHYSDKLLSVGYWKNKKFTPKKVFHI